MRDLTIELKQRPGELARVASTLARHQVTLKAGSALAIGTRFIARLIPSDIDAARRALDAAGVRFEESEVVKVVLESRDPRRRTPGSKIPGLDNWVIW